MKLAITGDDSAQKLSKHKFGSSGEFRSTLGVTQMQNQIKTMLLRGDGNSTIGMGHLYRLFAFAEILKNNFEFKIITSADTKTDVSKGYDMIRLPVGIQKDQEAQWLHDQFGSNDCAVVLDGYNFGSEYQKSIKDVGFTLVYIDDFVEDHMYADLVINHSPLINKSDYKCESYTKFALGTEYALLRPEFNKAAQSPGYINKPNVGFICFGGSVQAELVFNYTGALLSLGRLKKIHVVIGDIAKNEQLYLLSKKSKVVDIHSGLDEQEMVQLMQQCDLAIVPASTVFLEACCIRMSILGGYFVENQKLPFENFLSKGLCLEIGDITGYKNSELSRKLSELLDMLNAEGVIESLLSNQQRLFNGQQRQRLLEKLI